MNHTRNSQTNMRPGFTMVELLVAIGITLILVFFLNSIFGNVASAVQLGIANSQLISAGSTVNAQLLEDSKMMVGPTGDGFMVIVNQNPSQGGGRYFRSPIAKKESISVVKSGTGRRPVEKALRSDQLAFIRLRGTLQSMCPSSEDSYSLSRTKLKASYVRVWYGHARKTNVLGELRGGEDTDLPEIASNWTLGRQALFFEDPTGIGNVPHYQALNNESNPASKQIKSANTWQVVGYGGGAKRRWIDGTSDILGLDYPDAIASLKAYDNPELKDYQNVGGTTLKYIDFVYTNPNERLLCNPYPAASLGYQSWQIAQMHPYFADNLSDFIVEFAGDFVQPFDGQLDKVGNNEAGAIVWYDGINNAPPPPTDKSEGYEKLAGREGSTIMVWKPGKAARWPHLIRVTYRLHDSGGQVVADDGAPGRLFQQVLKVKRD